MAKILAHVHGYIGVHNAGAESYLANMLEFLVSKGHEATVLTAPNMGKDGSFINCVKLNTKCDNKD